MNDNLEQKTASVLEEALNLKNEGKRLSHVIDKFPDYETEIREVFGIAAFIKENKDKIIAPVNVFKTLLSKISNNSPIQIEISPKLEMISKKEIRQEDNIFDANAGEYEHTESADFLIESKENNALKKWKIIISVIILAIVTGIMLFKSNSKPKDEMIDKNSETSQDSNASGTPMLDAQNQTTVI